MRRISLALALVSAFAVGCSGGSKPARTDSGAAKGVTGQYYYVNLFSPPVGGYVQAATAPAIDCGQTSEPVVPATVPPSEHLALTHTACGVPFGGAAGTGQTRIAWGTDVTLTAVADTDSGYAFVGWAGDCSGAGACELTSGSDKTVVAIFTNGVTGHTNFTDPVIHGAAFNAGTLDCTQCHGAQLQGQGIAPSCSSCHSLAAGGAGGVGGPETCNTCHGAGNALAVSTVHATAGKVAVTVTPVAAAADTANLQYTVTATVDGVGRAGLTSGGAYRYAYNPAREAATVIAAYERFSLTAGTTTGAYGLADAGNGTYTVTLYGNGPTGAAPLTGNQTFALRLQSSATPGPTVVYATGVSHLNAPARDLVGNQACVNCHGDQVFRHREANGEWHHGANPYGVEACIVCHTRYGSISRSAGGDRLTAYVHGVHNSTNMPARDITANLGTPPAPFTVNKPAGVYARNDSLRLVAGSTTVAEISSPWSVGFPGYLINCSICHDTPARLNAIMGMAVSTSTCLSCHDSWDGFPTFVATDPSYTAKLAANAGWATVVADHRAIALPAASTATANACAACHDGVTAFGTVGDVHAVRITERNGVVYKGQDLSISEGAKVELSVDSVSYDAALPGKVIVTWSARQNGVAVNPCNTNIAAGPVFMGAAANAATGQSASNMSLLQAFAQGDDWVNAGVGTSAGQPASAPTLVMTGSQAATSGYTSCAGNVATSTIAAPTTTATKGLMALQGKPQITFTDGSFSRVIQLRSNSPTREFVPGTGAATAANRRQVVSIEKCLACHPGSLYQHGGNRVDSIELCIMCHNPASSEKSTRVNMGVTAAEAFDGKPGETIDLRTMVHAIHSAGETGAPLVYYRTNGIYAFGSQAAIDALPGWPGAGCFAVPGSEKSQSASGFGTTGAQCDATATGAAVPTKKNFNEIVVHYPRALNDCGACHLDGTANGFGDQAGRMAVTVDPGDMSSNAAIAIQTDDVLKGAGAASCTSCHQSATPAVQAAIQGHASSYGFTPAVFPVGRQSLINIAVCGDVTCP